MTSTVYKVAVALLISLLGTSLLLLIMDASPGQVYWLMLKDTWGSTSGIASVLSKSTPLMFTGLAAAIGFRAGLFNIGGEGQLAAACFATAVVGAALPQERSGAVAIPLLLLVAAMTGALLAALAGTLKAWRGVHEVVTTILLNFTIFGFILWLGNDYFFVGDSARTTLLPANFHLPRIGTSASSLNLSLLVALMIAAGIAWWFGKSWRGRQWLAVGDAPQAAQVAGISAKRTWISAMALSGAIAGLSASHYVLGYKYYYESQIGSGYGYLGLAVAIVGRNKVSGVLAAALLFGTLRHGGVAVTRLVPREVILAWEAMTILAVVAVFGFYSQRRRS